MSCLVFALFPFARMTHEDRTGQPMTCRIGLHKPLAQDVTPKGEVSQV